ncbi:bleomycin resistance protein [Caulobacter vibrioides]|nr:bleomycin resistance protein [Caulobacter vibrioides]
MKRTEPTLTIADDIDLGLTHLALVIRDLDRSRGFYETFAGLRMVHARQAGGAIERVAWMADPRGAFAVVLVESRALNDTPLGPFGHLGLACASRCEVDRLAALAKAQGVLRSAPVDGGHPVGYWAYIADPDGNTLEVSYGQQIRFSASGDGAFQRP